MSRMGRETESMLVRYALNDLPAPEKAVAKVAALDRDPVRHGQIHGQKETRARECLQTRVELGARGEI